MVPITVEKQDVIAGHVRLSALQRLHTVEERKAALAAYGNSLLYGHTHIPRAEKSRGRWMLNPGSVSIPKNGNPPSYAVLENGTFTVKDMDGKAFLSVSNG